MLHQMSQFFLCFFFLPVGNAQILSTKLSKTKPGTRNTLNQPNKNNFQCLFYRFLIFLGFLFVFSFAYCQFSRVVPGMFRGRSGCVPRERFRSFIGWTGCNIMFLCSEDFSTCRARQYNIFLLIQRPKLPNSAHSVLHFKRQLKQSDSYAIFNWFGVYFCFR